MKYYTVSEFAKTVGISRQAVHKRLKTTLKPYVKKVDKRLTISQDAVNLFVNTTSTVDNAENVNTNKANAENINDNVDTTSTVDTSTVDNVDNLPIDMALVKDVNLNALIQQNKELIAMLQDDVKHEREQVKTLQQKNDVLKDENTELRIQVEQYKELQRLNWWQRRKRLKELAQGEGEQNV